MPWKACPPTYEPNITDCSFCPDIIARVWCSNGVCRTVAQTLQASSEPIGCAGKVLATHSTAAISYRLSFWCEGGSLHEVVLVRLGLCLGCGGVLRGCAAPATCRRLQQIGGHRGWLGQVGCAERRAVGACRGGRRLQEGQGRGAPSPPCGRSRNPIGASRSRPSSSSSPMW